MPASSPPLRNFDIDVLRSLVAMVELGGLAQAGRQRGRTVAALSLQMRKLEEQAGTGLFVKEGRRLALTEAGEVMLGYGKRILALNDEAQMKLRASGVSGLVRLGTSQDFGDSWLPPVLARFRQEHPGVDMEVCIDRSSQLTQALDDGQLDMVLTMGMNARPTSTCVGRLPLVWIAHRDFEWQRSDPLPLAVFPVPCRFRARANAELDAAQIGWHVAVTSSSLYGVWAAVSAKLGVTLRTAQGLGPDLEVVDRKFGLPDLGLVDVSLTTASNARSPALRSLMQMLQDALRVRVSELGGFTPEPAAEEEILAA
jgi:DNA-binding transcriptional LysR family regulator